MKDRTGLFGVIFAISTLIILVFGLLILCMVTLDQYETLLENSYIETIYINEVFDDVTQHRSGMMGGYTRYHISATNIKSGITKDYFIHRGWELDSIGTFRVGNRYNATITEIENKVYPIIWMLE